MAGEYIGPLSTIIGEGVGLAVGNPVLGAKLGSAAGGLGTMIAGKRAKTKAEGMRPNEVDPNELARLEEAKRRLKSMETGTDSATQSALSESKRLTEATKSDISKVTGGNVGGTIDAMLKAQRMGGRTSNQAIGMGARRADAFSRVVDSMAARIEKRKRDIQQNKSDQLFAEAAEAIQTGSQNFMSSGFSSLPVDEKGNDSNSPNSGNEAPSGATPGISGSGSSSGSVAGSGAGTGSAGGAGAAGAGGGA